jgi:hypothetical protein
MIIYARQVPPEHQESPLFWDLDALPEHIHIGGNAKLKELRFDEIRALWGRLAEAAGDLYEARQGRLALCWADDLRELLPRESGDYTRAERLRWRDILTDEKALYSSQKYRVFCQALEILTGRGWDFCTLRGCCQSDWQYCLFPENDWNGEALEHLEAEYFNTGTEWIVHDDESTPGSPDEINGFSVYCHGWNNDQIRREIADAAGGNPDEVQLYQFAGYEKRARYEEV